MDRGTADFYDAFAAEKAPEYAKTRSPAARRFTTTFPAGARVLDVLVPGGRLLLTLPALREDHVTGDRDDEGRQFWNHDPAMFEALLASLGCRRLEHSINDAVLETTGTRWHMWLFERCA